MLTKWIAAGLAAVLSGGSALAQVETDIKRGDSIVSALIIGEGDHVVIAVNWSGQGGGGFSEVDTAIAHARETGAKKLFAFNKHDHHASWQSVAFDKSAEPKQKIELGGNGHNVGELIRGKPDLARDVVGILRQ